MAPGVLQSMSGHASLLSTGISRLCLRSDKPRLKLTRYRGIDVSGFFAPEREAEAGRVRKLRRPRIRG